MRQDLQECSKLPLPSNVGKYGSRAANTDCYMDSAGKLDVGTPEEAAFRKCYKYLLEAACRPVEFSKTLLSKGIITSETRDSIALDRYEVRAKEAILHAIQCAFAQSSDKDRLLSSIQSALIESGVSPHLVYWMEGFIAGE